MKTITAVPESITQQQYVDLIASVGFEPKDLRKLEFRKDGIYAEVFERGPNGGLVLDESAHEVVINTVWIPVEES